MNTLLFKLNCKTILKSLMFYIFVTFIFLMHGIFIIRTVIRSEYINFLFSFEKFEYAGIFMYVLLFCIAVYFAQKNYTLETVCFVSHAKAAMMRFVSVVTLSCVVFVIPIVYMATCSLIQNVGITYTFISIVFTLIKWLIMILSAQSFGFIAGTVLKTSYTYLFAIPITIMNTCINNTVFRFFLGNDYEKYADIYHFLSSQGMFGNGIPVEYRGPILDTLMLTKLAVAIMLFVIAIIIVMIVAGGKLSFKYVTASAISVCLIITLSVCYFKLFPKRYYEYEKLYMTDYEQQPFEIVSYSGQIELREWSSYNISVGIKSLGKADTLKLRLDESMKINSLKIKDSPVEYTREKDLLTVNCPLDDFTLDISCSGRIAYVSFLNTVNIYTSPLSSALPSGFAFLPKIDGEQSVKKYDLEIDCANTLVSNVDCIKSNGVYIISGDAEELCLFSGFLTSEIIDGKTFYFAKYDNITDHREVYNSYREHTMYFDPYSGEIVDGLWEEKDTVLMIYTMYGNNGFAIPYGDYVMLDYGTPWKVRK